MRNVKLKVLERRFLTSPRRTTVVVRVQGRLGKLPRTVVPLSGDRSEVMWAEPVSWRHRVRRRITGHLTMRFTTTDVKVR